MFWRLSPEEGEARTRARIRDRIRPFFGLACFFEAMDVPVGGTVVPQRSATLDGCIPLPIPANDSDMPKFSSRQDANYRRVVGELLSWLSRTGTAKAAAEDATSAEASGGGGGRSDGATG